MLQLFVEWGLLQSVLDLFKDVREDRLRWVVALQLIYYFKERSLCDPVINSD